MAISLIFLRRCDYSVQQGPRRLVAGPTERPHWCLPIQLCATPMKGVNWGEGAVVAEGERWKKKEVVANNEDNQQQQEGEEEESQSWMAFWMNKFSLLKKKIIELINIVAIRYLSLRLLFHYVFFFFFFFVGFSLSALQISFSWDSNQRPQHGLAGQDLPALEPNTYIYIYMDHMLQKQM